MSSFFGVGSDGHECVHPVIPDLHIASNENAKIAVSHVFRADIATEQITDAAFNLITAITRNQRTGEPQVPAMADTVWHQAAARREAAILLIRSDHAALEISRDRMRIGDRYSFALSPDHQIIDTRDEQGKRLLNDLGVDTEWLMQTLEILSVHAAETFEFIARHDLARPVSSSFSQSAEQDLDRLIIQQTVLLCLHRSLPLLTEIHQLATSPLMGGFDGHNTWKNLGHVCSAALVPPALAISTLIRTPNSPDSDNLGAVEQAIRNRLLPNDRRLVELAYEVLNRFGSCWKTRTGKAFVAREIGKYLNNQLAPLCAVTPQLLKEEGLGRLSFSEERYGVTPSHAVVAVALSLMAAPERARICIAAVRTGNHLPQTLPFALRSGKKNALYRTIGFLRKRFQADRHAQTAAFDHESHPNRALAKKAIRSLAQPEATEALRKFEISPNHWFGLSNICQAASPQPD
jgi:hypothetical protein